MLFCAAEEGRVLVWQQAEKCIDMVTEGAMLHLVISLPPATLSRQPKHYFLTR